LLSSSRREDKQSRRLGLDLTSAIAFGARKETAGNARDDNQRLLVIIEDFAPLLVPLLPSRKLCYLFLARSADNSDRTLWPKNGFTSRNLLRDQALPMFF